MSFYFFDVQCYDFFHCLFFLIYLYVIYHFRALSITLMLNITSGHTSFSLFISMTQSRVTTLHSSYMFIVWLVDVKYKRIFWQKQFPITTRFIFIFVFLPFSTQLLL